MTFAPEAPLSSLGPVPIGTNDEANSAFECLLRVCHNRKGSKRAQHFRLLDRYIGWLGAI